jgi:hypothetical protein
MLGLTVPDKLLSRILCSPDFEQTYAMLIREAASAGWITQQLIEALLTTQRAEPRFGLVAEHVLTFPAWQANRERAF